MHKMKLCTYKRICLYALKIFIDKLLRVTKLNVPYWLPFILFCKILANIYAPILKFSSL